MAIEDRLEELFMKDANSRRVASVNMPQRPSPWRGVATFAATAAIVGIVAIAAILALRGDPQAAAPKVTASPIPTTTSVPTVAPTVAPTATVAPSSTSVPVATGSISGGLGYPSDFIPAMKIFAVNTEDSSKWYRVDTALNPPGNSYTLGNVPAGTYRVYAYTSNSTSTNWAGGSYTEYVRCGMQPPCSDHTVIVISVSAGHTTEGVNLQDWYVSQGAYPPPPQ